MSLKIPQVDSCAFLSQIIDFFSQIIKIIKICYFFILTKLICFSNINQIFIDVKFQKNNENLIGVDSNVDSLWVWSPTRNQLGAKFWILKVWMDPARTPMAGHVFVILFDVTFIHLAYSSLATPLPCNISQSCTT